MTWRPLIREERLAQLAACAERVAATRARPVVPRRAAAAVPLPLGLDPAARAAFIAQLAVLDRAIALRIPRDLAIAASRRLAPEVELVAIAAEHTDEKRLERAAVGWYGRLNART